MPERGDSRNTPQEFSLLLEQAKQYERKIKKLQGFIESHRVLIEDSPKELEALDPKSEDYEKDKNLLEYNTKKAKQNIKDIEKMIAEYKIILENLITEDAAIKRFLMEDKGKGDS